jgi:hypothetical protein
MMDAAKILGRGDSLSRRTGRLTIRRLHERVRYGEGLVTPNASRKRWEAQRIPLKLPELRRYVSCFA